MVRSYDGLSSLGGQKEIGGKQIVIQFDRKLIGKESKYINNSLKILGLTEKNYSKQLIEQKYRRLSP